VSDILIVLSGARTALPMGVAPEPMDDCEVVMRTLRDIIRVLRYCGADELEDVICGVATAAAKLTGHDLVGPPFAYVVSFELTGPCALTKSFPRSSCIMEIMGHRFASSCNTCIAGSASIFSDAHLTSQIRSNFPLYKEDPRFNFRFTCASLFILFFASCPPLLLRPSFPNSKGETQTPWERRRSPHPPALLLALPVPRRLVPLRSPPPPP
jgi:hypothetical protein